MRANVVFVLLILLLAGLVSGLVARGRMPHVTTALPEPTLAIEGDASVGTKASPSSSSRPDAPPATDAPSRTARPDSPPPAPLDRPLRVVSSAWELAAPGVIANGSPETDQSLFSRERLDVTLSASSETIEVENALARGGDDPAGADVIILPLPRFVAAFERLEVLEPRIFFVVGFASGGDIVAGPRALTELDGEETITLHAPVGSTAALLGLFAFDTVGIPVKLAHEPADDATGPWRALTRRPSTAGASALEGKVLVSTRAASRLVPHVAIARARFLRDHPNAAAALVEGWLEGQRMVEADREAAARAIAALPGAPAMLTALNDLRVIAPTNLTDNARLMELAGRDAVTLPRLFDRTRSWWRRAGLITESRPLASRPVDGSIVALVARRHRLVDDDEPPSRDDDTPSDTDDTAKGDTKTEPITTGQVHLVQRLRGATLDDEALTNAIGWLAGVFPDSVIEVSVHPGAVADDEATARALARARGRYELDESRLVAGTTNGRAATVATIRVRATRP